MAGILGGRPSGGWDEKVQGGRNRGNGSVMPCAIVPRLLFGGVDKSHATVG
jgi:hypothetical protein